MASLTPWAWVWVDSGSWWWTGRPGVLRSMGSQSVGHDWATELLLLLFSMGLRQKELNLFFSLCPIIFLTKFIQTPPPPSTTVFKSISPNISDFLWTHYLPKRSRRFSVTQKQTNKQAYFTEVLKQVWSTVRKQEVRHSEGSFSFAWRHCPVYKDSALHLPQEVSLFLLTVELMAVLGRKSTVKKSLILIVIVFPFFVLCKLFFLFWIKWCIIQGSSWQTTGAAKLSRMGLIKGCR